MRNTTIKGNRMIPNGGKIKEPIRTAKAAPRSPCFVPPKRFTDSELAKISARSNTVVKTIIDTQKNVVNTFGLIRK